MPLFNDVAKVASFFSSWTALRTAVDALPAGAFAQESGCVGWLVQDLVCHLIIDAQDVLITLATPDETAATHDSVTYWEVSPTPGRDDPLDALVVRLAAAYEEPWLLKHHFDDVAAAAGRAAQLVDPTSRVATQGKVLTAGDYLTAYVLESTLHHLDLVEHLEGIPTASREGLSKARDLLEEIAGATFPKTFSDEDALLIGTGRRAPTDSQQALLGSTTGRLPLILG